VCLALLRRHGAPDRRHEHAQPRHARAACSDDADEEDEHPGRHRIGREHGANGHEDAAEGDHAPRAVFVRDRASEGLRDAPHELRAGEGEADRGNAETGRGVDRADEESLRLAHAEEQREYRGGRDDQPDLSAGHERT